MAESTPSAEPLAAGQGARRRTPQERVPPGLTRAFNCRKEAVTSSAALAQASAAGLFERGMMFRSQLPRPSAAPPDPDDYVRADEEGCMWLPHSFYAHLLPHGVPCAYCPCLGATYQRWASSSPRYIHGMPGVHVYYCDYRCHACGKGFNGLNVAFIAKLPPAVRHAFPALLSADTGVTWTALNWLVDHAVNGVGFADAARAFERKKEEAHSRAHMAFRRAQEAAAAAAAARAAPAAAAAVRALAARTTAAPVAAAAASTLADAAPAFGAPSTWPADGAPAADAAVGAPDSTRAAGAPDVAPAACAPPAAVGVLEALFAMPAGAPSAVAATDALAAMTAAAISVPGAAGGADLRSYYLPTQPMRLTTAADVVRSAASFPSYEASHGTPVCPATVAQFVLGFVKAVLPLIYARLAAYIPEIISLDDGRKLCKNIIGDDAKNLRVCVGDGSQICKVWISSTTSEADNISHLKELCARIEDAGAPPLKACYVDTGCCNNSIVGGGRRSEMRIAVALGLSGLSLDCYHWLARWDDGLDDTSPAYKLFKRDMAEALLIPHEDVLADVARVMMDNDASYQGLDPTLMRQFAIREGKDRHVLPCFVPPPAVLNERVFDVLEVHRRTDAERCAQLHGYRTLYKENIAAVIRRQQVHVLNGCLTDPCLPDGSPVQLYIALPGKFWNGLQVLRCMRGEGFNEAVFSTSNDLLPGGHTSITTAHTLLMLSLDSRNVRAHAMRQGLPKPVSYHPWDEAVIDGLEASLGVERAFPRSRPQLTLERFGAPAHALKWTAEHELIASNAETLRFGDGGMAALLPRPRRLLLPTTAGAASAAALAAAAATFSCDGAGGGGCLTPRAASQASQRMQARSECAWSAVPAAAAAEESESAPMLSHGRGGGAYTPPRPRLASQALHAPPAIAPGAAAVDARAESASMFSCEGGGCSPTPPRALPAHLKAPSWRGPGAVIALGATAAATPAHAARPAAFSSVEEDLLLTELLQQLGDSGVQNESDLLRLTNDFNRRCVSLALRLMPGEDRRIWPKTFEHVQRRVAAIAGLNRRVESADARRAITQCLTGQPQPPAAPIEPLRAQPPPPPAPPRAPFAFAAPAPGTQRTASKGGPGKPRYNGCCGQPSAAGPQACGKRYQEDCPFGGVAQTVEGLERLTCPAQQPAGVWRSKDDILALKRKLRQLSPAEKEAQFHVLKRPCRRPS